MSDQYLTVTAPGNMAKNLTSMVKHGGGFIMMRGWSCFWTIKLQNQLWLSVEWVKTKYLSSRVLHFVLMPIVDSTKKLDDHMRYLKKLKNGDKNEIHQISCIVFSDTSAVWIWLALKVMSSK